MPDLNALAALACQPNTVEILGVPIEIRPLSLAEIARLGAQHQDSINLVLELLGKHATATGFDVAGLLKAAPDIVELVKRFPALCADAISASVGGDAGSAASLPAGVQIALLIAIWKRFQDDMSLVADTLGNPKAGGQNTGQPPSPDAGNASLQKAIRQAITQPPAPP